ncbi:hypothetical protein [Nonomuraea pusilla]|uniref:Uncharacterized protein n=1 Tax=Nonomuraea pusilla TaxID=46177 RepID=A0A1H8K4U9_9ACTN|nr:hypothetical protein [Nonomuraea pusilla]SEN87983.1 hypothetical protein SAMN05660976_08524 [Nonomuraea pusilla]
MTDLRLCCQQAAIDGLDPLDHWPHCDGRSDDPDQDPLFDVIPPATAGLSRTSPDGPGQDRTTLEVAGD